MGGSKKERREEWVVEAFNVYVPGAQECHIFCPSIELFKSLGIDEWIAKNRGAERDYPMVVDFMRERLAGIEDPTERRTLTVVVSDAIASWRNGRHEEAMFRIAAICWALQPPDFIRKWSDVLDCARSEQTRRDGHKEHVGTVAELRQKEAKRLLESMSRDEPETKREVLVQRVAEQLEVSERTVWRYLEKNS